MNHAQKQKKNEEDKGFDMIEASFLEKGLVAARNTRQMGLMAVSQAHSTREKHHAEKVKKHEREERKKARKEHSQSVKMRMRHYAGLIPVKVKPKYGYMPHQLKKPSVDDSDSGKKR